MKTTKLLFGILTIALALEIGSNAQAQNLFVSDFSYGKIYTFTTNGVQRTFASGLNGPFGLAFDIEGNLFVSDYFSGNIYKFTTNGVQSTFASGLNGPAALAFDKMGNLFVGADNIYKFTTNGVQSTFASGLNLPYGLAFDAAGNLYEADAGSGNIFKFTTNGVQSTFASGQNLVNAEGLAFNSAGILFVTTMGSSGTGGTGNIYTFTTNGAQSSFASGLKWPVGMVFNSAGILFEANRASGNIYTFTTNGVQSTFVSGLSDPFGLAFQPVPFPPPTLTLNKAVWVGLSNLQIGSNYQIQVSTDLLNWTNSGTVFTVTNSCWHSPNYWDVDNWSQLFFRVQMVP